MSRSDGKMKFGFITLNPIYTDADSGIKPWFTCEGDVPAGEYWCPTHKPEMNRRFKQLKESILENFSDYLTWCEDGE